MSSLCLFKVAVCGLDIMKNFSVIHKLHGLVGPVYAFALLIFSRVPLGCIFDLKRFSV